MLLNAREIATAVAINEKRGFRRTHELVGLQHCYRYDGEAVVTVANNRYVVIGLGVESCAACGPAGMVECGDVPKCWFDVVKEVDVKDLVLLRQAWV